MKIFQQKSHALILYFLIVVTVLFKAEEIQYTAARDYDNLKTDLHNLTNTVATWEDRTTSTPFLSRLRLFPSLVLALLPFSSPLLSRKTASVKLYSHHDGDTSISPPRAKYFINQKRKQMKNIQTDYAISVSENDRNLNFTNITFRKCCAKIEHFDPHFRCVKTKLKRDLIQGNDTLETNFPWFPSNILVDSHLKLISPDHLKFSHIKTEYGYKPICDDSEYMTLQWNHDDPSLFFIFIDNGSLVEMEHSRMIGMWSPDSYCLEAVESSYRYHVGILCPCLHITCVRKCCPRGYYYNLSYNLCTEFEDPVKTKNPYRPKFFNGEARASLIDYYLLRAMPPCAGKKIEMLHSATVEKDFPVYIQTNGSLAAPGLHFPIINNSRYCADIFIDSVGKRTVNVLYCMRRFSRYADDNTYSIARGDLFTINALLFLVALTLIAISE